MPRLKRSLVGRKLVLLVSFGNPPGQLEAGAVGIVREIVPAATKGAHDDTEEALVVEFPVVSAYRKPLEWAITRDAATGKVASRTVLKWDSKVQQVASLRAVAFGASQVATMLKEAE